MAFGLLLYLCGTILWIYVLSKEKLVVVYAFTALTFVLVYLGAVLTLGESLTIRASGGMLLVLAGLYLLAADEGRLMRELDSGVAAAGVSEDPAVTFVVPCHNEELVIQGTALGAARR